MRNLLLITALGLLQAGCAGNDTQLRRAPLLTFAELEAEISISREPLVDTRNEITDMDSIVAARQAVQADK